MAGLAVDNKSFLEWNPFCKKHLRAEEHKEDKEYQEDYGSEYYGADEEDEEVEEDIEDKGDKEGKEDKEGKVLSFWKLWTSLLFWTWISGKFCVNFWYFGHCLVCFASKNCFRFFY